MAGRWTNAKGLHLVKVEVGLRMVSIPTGVVQLYMGGGVTLPTDNVSCQESADGS